jgi:hypothetical protein
LGIPETMMVLSVTVPHLDVSHLPTAILTLMISWFYSCLFREGGEIDESRKMVRDEKLRRKMLRGFILIVDSRDRLLKKSENRRQIRSSSSAVQEERSSS